MNINISEITQYRNKNLYFSKAPGAAIAISYNTIIAASKEGITFITSGYYSNTTSHHKTDALRYFNNTDNIEVTPDTLYKIAAGAPILPIIQEEEFKRYLIKTIKTGGIPNHIKTPEYVQKIKHEKKDFKNGNKKYWNYYKTNFKYVSNINFKITIHDQTATKQKKKIYIAPDLPEGIKEHIDINTYITRSGVILS